MADEGDSTAAMFARVAREPGAVTLTFEPYFARAPRPGLSLARLEPPLLLEMLLIVRDGDLPPAVERLQEHLTAAAATRAQPDPTDRRPVPADPGPAQRGRP